ncbi:MAG: prepilin-type N-terminal cleavage/methylation domain-containing protein [Patescibacteria group bacterium]|nr:prepilin-type N-terminal cleavage/methylation domain-containing protein [Patescibacteria group bacterium]
MSKEKKLKNLKKKLLITPKNGGGFTLIEMLMAIAIFISVITVTSAIFVFSLRAQRQNLASQELLDQTSYLMEYMSRAIRMAQKDMDGSCTSEVKLNYLFDGQCLKFKNYHGECQQFCWDGVRLKEIKDNVKNYLTSPDLRVNSFSVTLTGETQLDSLQPLVSIFLEIAGKEQSKIQIQTSISQRPLDVKK